MIRTRLLFTATAMWIVSLWCNSCTNDNSDINNADTSPDTAVDSSSDSNAVPAFSPLEWNFDDGWDGFEHAFGDVRFTHDPALGALVLDATFTGPSQESSFGKEFFAADWRGAKVIEITVRTEDHMSGFWRVDLESGYAWSPCIAQFDHPASTEWTVLTFNIDQLCPDASLELTQVLIVGVVTGPDAGPSEHVRVAVDQITVR